MNFPVARQSLDHAQQLLADKTRRPLSHYVYPPSPFSERDRQHAQQALAATEIAQPALGAASVAACRLLAELGLEPHLTAGHSYGEFAALWAAGVLTVDELLSLSHLRGELIREATQQDGAGGMAAIHADASTAASLAEGLASVTLANVNAPDQIVLSASQEELEKLLDRAQKKRVRAQRLPVACAFHSPLVADANEPLAKRLHEHDFRAPDKPVYSNVTALPYGEGLDEIRATLSRHLTSPVKFVDQIEAMYSAGARVFVEAGPNDVLTSLTRRILGDKQHLAIAIDVPGRDGLLQLAHALGRLFTEGMPLRLEKLFAPRHIPALDLSRVNDRNGGLSHSPSTWLVNGVRSRAQNAPEPQILGTRQEPQYSPPASDRATLHKHTPSTSSREVASETSPIAVEKMQI
ncbi:MAG: ACP S-malonyltransferase, partial [Planctomycetota bacterium]